MKDRYNENHGAQAIGYTDRFNNVLNNFSKTSWAHNLRKEYLDSLLYQIGEYGTRVYMTTGLERPLYPNERDNSHLINANKNHRAIEALRLIAEIFKHCYNYSGENGNSKISERLCLEINKTSLALDQLFNEEIKIGKYSHWAYDINEEELFIVFWMVWEYGTKVDTIDKPTDISFPDNQHLIEINNSSSIAKEALRILAFLVNKRFWFKNVNFSLETAVDRMENAKNSYGKCVTEVIHPSYPSWYTNIWYNENISVTANRRMKSIATNSKYEKHDEEEIAEIISQLESENYDSERCMKKQKENEILRRKEEERIKKLALKLKADWVLRNCKEIVGSEFINIIADLNILFKTLSTYPKKYNTINKCETKIYDPRLLAIHHAKDASEIPMYWAKYVGNRELMIDLVKKDWIKFLWAEKLGDREILRDRIQDQGLIYRWAIELGDTKYMKSKITEQPWAYAWAMDIGDRELMKNKIKDSSWAFLWAVRVGDKKDMRNRISDPVWAFIWSNYFHDKEMLKSKVPEYHWIRFEYNFIVNKYFNPKMRKAPLKGYESVFDINDIQLWNRLIENHK